MDLNKYRFFPVHYFEDAEVGGYSVLVRGCHGATDGNTFEQAQKMARELVLDFSYFKYSDHEIFDGASKAEEGDQILDKGDQILDIGIDSALKIMLRNLLVKLKVSQCELGRRLGLSKTEISSVLNPRKTTRLTTLAKCFEILGSPLNISC